MPRVMTSCGLFLSPTYITLITLFHTLPNTFPLRNNTSMAQPNSPPIIHGHGTHPPAPSDPSPQAPASPTVSPPHGADKYEGPVFAPFMPNEMFKLPPSVRSHMVVAIRMLTQEREVLSEVPRYLLIGTNGVGVLVPSKFPQMIEARCPLELIESLRIKTTGCDPKPQMFIKMKRDAGVRDVLFLAVPSQDNMPKIAGAEDVLRAIRYAIWCKTGKVVEIQALNAQADIAAGGQLSVGRRLPEAVQQSPEVLRASSVKKTRPGEENADNTTTPNTSATTASATRHTAFQPEGTAAASVVLPRSPAPAASPPPRRAEMASVETQAGTGRWRDDEIRSRSGDDNVVETASQAVSASIPPPMLQEQYPAVYQSPHQMYPMPYPPLPHYSSPPAFVQEYIDYVRPRDASGSPVTHAGLSQGRAPVVMQQAPQVQQVQQYAPVVAQSVSPVPSGMGRSPGLPVADRDGSVSVGSHPATPMMLPKGEGGGGGGGVMVPHGGSVVGQPTSWGVTTPTANVRVNLHVNFVNLSDARNDRA